ncbi:response regulator [Nocardioides sp.]|uniref:response regulator n=1 Tax=Nocardioides sp. TaxID=35761 RepID=UPI001A205742|nr:response regulator [Nocardioides sp.]MBJ7358944.1 response regulator [Nocardioides sp.]
MSVPTVLVVDDNDDIRELAQLCLETVDGWTVLTAGSGPDAIEVAREHKPDAVLLDMMMPGMDGLTTFEHLQSDDSTRDIPVLLFTAKLQARDRQVWEGTAIRGTIAKPFDPMTLGDQVSRTLKWPTRERA